MPASRKPISQPSQQLENHQSPSPVSKPLIASKPIVESILTPQLSAQAILEKMGPFDDTRSRLPALQKDGMIAVLTFDPGGTAASFAMGPAPCITLDPGGKAASFVISTAPCITFDPGDDAPPSSDPAVMAIVAVVPIAAPSGGRITDPPPSQPHPAI